MAYTKESYKRFFIIDSCINNKYRPMPKMEDLIEACEREFDKVFDKSTIQKDIKAMKFDAVLGFNAPIKYSRSHQGYYYDSKDYSIKTIQLNQTEIDSLHAVVDIIKVYGGERVSKNFNHAVEKIFSSLKERYETADKSDRQIVQTENAPEQKGFELFDLFVHVTKEKTPINFVHYSYELRSFSSVIFHPYLIKEFQNRWYAIGFSDTHDKIKVFGMDRIIEPFILKKEFFLMRTFDPNFYINDIFGVFPYGNQPKQKIEFNVSPEIANFFISQPIHSSQLVEKYYETGHLILSLNLVPSIELIRLFLQYSPNLSVIKPIWLKNKITAIHQKCITV